MLTNTYATLCLITSNNFKFVKLIAHSKSFKRLLPNPVPGRL